MSDKLFGLDQISKLTKISKLWSIGPDLDLSDNLIVDDISGRDAFNHGNLITNIGRI